ncbi:hypothetical protein RSOLAG22IIIB_06597 [Rhizoctonia solani]|uniref:ZZ-type domain-containing protein n=1 Tax=Rhizoctonia solani TaxID=456999 RepID=A0A0K6GFK0_9AGAM|nr:hypothetical protein RSOLAG22IIIB_06597 [Rhizoctonia solani]
MTLVETLGINSRSTKPCRDMTDQELLDDELWHRTELVRLVLSLSIHIGTCTTHGVLTVGATLPIHLPVVIFIAYRLTKVALRHRAIKTEVKTNRSGMKLKRLSSSGGKRLTGGLILMILTPILAAVGADLVNEIVSAIAGSDPVAIANVGSSLSELSLGECSTDNSGIDIVLATDDSSHSNDISACGEASETIIEELLRIWSDKLINSVSSEFQQLVKDIDPANQASGTLPSHYRVHCNACHTRINKGYSCTECHDLDLCYGCFVGVKHQDVKRHAYTEFKVQEEISQIQRIMISLRRESVIVEHGRGSHTQCNVCCHVISEPTRLSRRNKAPVTYYRCKTCPDFDICNKCFPIEAAKDIHEDHKFNMILATDDEATISRLSPPTHTRSPSGSSRSGSSSYLKTPVGSPEFLASPTLKSHRSHSSLFSPTFGPPSPSLSIPRSPSYSSIPENIWLPGPNIACDACQRNINDDRRLNCDDCGVDLHIKCQNWSDLGHKSHHHTRIFVKAS